MHSSLCTRGTVSAEQWRATALPCLCSTVAGARAPPPWTAVNARATGNCTTGAYMRARAAPPHSMPFCVFAQTSMLTLPVRPCGRAAVFYIAHQHRQVHGRTGSPTCTRTAAYIAARESAHVRTRQRTASRRCTPRSRVTNSDISPSPCVRGKAGRQG